MSITHRAKTAVLSSLPASTWVLLSSMPSKGEQGWDSLTARWVCDFRGTVKTAAEVAGVFPIGSRFGSEQFWLTGAKPSCLGGNVWALDCEYKGLISSVFSGGATTNTSTTATMTSTTGLAAGMLLVHANLTPGTRVASVTNSTTIVLTLPAIATGTGLSFVVGRGLSFNSNSGTEAQSASDIDITDIYGSRTIPRIAVLEAAPTVSISYILINGTPPSDVLGTMGASPAITIPVRSSFWSSLTDPVENWPSGWVMTGCPSELLPGTQVAPNPNGVWLVNEEWQYRYRYAP